MFYTVFHMGGGTGGPGGNAPPPPQRLGTKVCYNRLMILNVHNH